MQNSERLTIFSSTITSEQAKVEKWCEKPTSTTDSPEEY